MRTTALFLALGLVACDGNETTVETTTEIPEGEAFASEDDKLSYAIGMKIGQDFDQQGIDVNTDLVKRGMDDVTSGGETLLAIDDLPTIIREGMLAKRKAAAEENAAEGEAFLAENAKRAEVQVTESGLQYEVIEEGKGATPTGTDRISAHYTGTLIDGTKFDSSHDRGQPASFRVNGVIKGWTEALQMMKEGAKWKLYIPGELAYGERGSPPNIGPNETLVFEVELVAIE